MKVIFLDIDGVLNYTQWYVDDRNPGNLYGQEGDLDPLCIERVKRICDETGAKVVISSDWKVTSFYGTVSRLVRAGLPEDYIIDKTPDVVMDKVGKKNYMHTNYEPNYRNSRGFEIDIWLSVHPDCTNYVILDDRSDFSEDQQPHFVHIDSYVGLTDDNADIAIMTLNHH